MRQRSNRFSRYLDDVDPTGDGVVAIVMDNDPRYLEIAWGIRQSGRYLTPVNWHLTPAEAAYIVDDCRASTIVANAARPDLATALTADLVPTVRRRILAGGSATGWDDYDDLLARYPSDPVPDEREGDLILYSSGTTGRPKGIRRRLTGRAMNLDQDCDRARSCRRSASAPAMSTCSPAPLYHAAPIHWSMAAQRLGGTVVVMERFDAEEALRLIERYRVTHANMVPTMFVRMLKLDPAVRARYDLSSLRQVIHAAAPCPVEVKRAMIDWWGPIISEFYSSSEGAGATFVDLRRVARHAGHGRPGDASARCTSSTTTASSCRPARSARSGPRASPQTLRVPQRRGRRRRSSATTAAGSRSAMSATSTTTATCS